MGRRKRNRKASDTKIKIKQKDKRVNPKQIPDKELRKRYDIKKSVYENLRNTDLKEMYENKLPEKIPEGPKHPMKIGDDEVPVVKKLIEKHGKDYKAMARNIKINKFQWTPIECKKRCFCYEAGMIRSEAAEVISGYRQDMRKPLFGKAKALNVFSH